MGQARRGSGDVGGSPRRDGEPAAPNTQVSTFVIGQLCAHTFSTTVLTEFEGYESPIARVWPISDDIQWPHIFSLSDRGVLSLSGAILRVLDPPPPNVI